MKKYRLFGETVNENQLRTILNGLPQERVRQVETFIKIQEKMKAEENIKNEKDPKKKEEMKRLYSKGIYDFDFLYGTK